MNRTIPFALVLCLAGSSAFAAQPDAWVLVQGRDSEWIHGDQADLEAARSHLGELGPGFLWFRRDGKQYVVRGDALKPLEDLAQQQKALGAEQGRLGKKQGALGRRQGDLGRKQALSASDGKEQAELGRQQRALGEQQAEMGREQHKLGEEQRDLSRQLRQKLQQLIEASLKDGSAKAL